MAVRRPKERAARAQQFELTAALVEQKLGDPELTLEWVARQLAVSPRHLQRVFTEQAGTGWRAYLEGQRLDRARALLEDRQLYEKGLSVREVSRTVGYYQPAGFAKAFRRHFGVSPHEVRPGRHPRSLLDVVAPVVRPDMADHQEKEQDAPHEQAGIPKFSGG